MKIKKIILENFRCFYGTVEIPVDDFTVFIGKNDQGKSSIFEAVDIFINEGKGIVKIDDEDLNKKAKEEGKDNFKIGIIFKFFQDKIIIDATNPTTLKDEYLLNNDGDLEIWKIFKKGKVIETFIRCNHPQNDEFLRDLLKKKIKELQKFVDENNINMQNLDKRKSADIRKAIRDYYKNRNGELHLGVINIKIDEEGLKEIWPKIQKYLPIYTLFHSDRKNVDQDAEIQDPLKAKIEQIFKRDEIQQKLAEIANEIDKEIREIADTTIKKFQDLTNSSVSVNIKPNIPEVASLKWKDVYKGIGFNTDNDIPLNKRGSGIRRLVLVSSFLAEVEKKTTNHSINHIIYAIEEPETSLHPDLQMNLINALTELSQDKNYQILISTHSPALIRLLEASSIRYVEQTDEYTNVKIFDEEVADKIVKNLGIIPSIAKVVICVEGKNDENFLLNINQNIPELKNIIDLKQKIESGIVAIIRMGGSNLGDWINKDVLKRTNVIEFHLYDKDEDSKYKTYIDKINKRRDGSIGMLTRKREIENYVPKEIVEEEFKIQLAIENWDEEDIPKKIMEKQNNLKEQNIKEILCGKCSKKITKKHLEYLDAWNEVEGWFKKIKELTDKAYQNFP